MNYSTLFESDHPIFNQSQNKSTLKVKKIDEKLSNNLWAVQCENVFSKDECQMIIDAAEAKGFEEALLNVGGGQQILANEIRKSLRLMVDDVRLTEEIFNRIRNVLPKTYFGCDLVGLNER